jgi:lactate dehydrogenase-like 2-hydroxyacid dehydrogenase
VSCVDSEFNSSCAIGETNVKRPILVVASRFPKEVEDRIDQEFEPRRNPNPAPFTRDQFLEAAEGADAMFITPGDRLDSTFFQKVSPTVKVIATYSVGYEHIDLDGAAKRKIALAYTPGVNHEATADIAMLLLLGASRRAYEAQELVRTHTWRPLAPNMLLGWQVGGKVLGIFGMGRIGQAVARRARGFGMKIHYSNSSRLSRELEGDAIYHDDPNELLRVSQFLTLHAPETPATHNFLNARTIALLPHGAIVVNTARGGLVVDEDLIAALKSGQVAAAGLDVFAGEPNLNPGYIDLKNTFLLPHIGSATVETRVAMGMLALDNIDAVLAGRPALTPVP